MSLEAQVTDCYYNRLKIHIARNGLTFIEDVRDRHRWTAELLRMHETATLEELPPSTVADKMQRIMYEHGLDMFEQRKMVFELFDGEVAWPLQ